MEYASTTAPPKGALSRLWNNLSVRLKIMAIVLVVVLIAVVAITGLSLSNTNNALVINTNKSLSALARTSANDIAALLVRNVENLQSYALDPAVVSELETQNATYSGTTADILAELTTMDKQWESASDNDPFIQKWLTNALAIRLDGIKFALPEYAEIFVTDRYGGLAGSSDRTSDYYQADEEWWQSAYNGGKGAVHISPPELDESTGVTGLDIAVPVYARNGETVGVLRTTLNISALIERLSNIEVGETGKADLVIGGKLYEMHKEEEGTVHEALEADTIAQITGSPQGYMRAKVGERPNLIGHSIVNALSGEKYVTDLGWHVVVHQAESEALASIRQQTPFIILLGLVTAVVATLLGIGMGRLLTRPISRLQTTVTEFTKGKLDARVAVESQDEIGVLAGNFNQMAEQVGGLLQTVQTRSVELEERTKELEASQRVTFAASEHATPDELLDLVVNLIRDQFDLYHAQVYMVDEQEQAAVLRQSTGYAGRQLLQRKHRIPLDATALVTRAIHTGEAVLVDDVKADPNFLPNPLLPDTRSELVVPLKREGKVIGVLDTQDRNPGRFNPSTIALFQTMTDQVAILFENSELLQRVTNQTEVMGLFTNQLRTAADIARRLGTILDPEQLLQEVVELIQSRFGLYHAHIYLLDEEAEILKLATGSGEVGRVLRERGHSIQMSAEKSLVARAARSRGAILIADTTLESDFMPNPLLPQTRSELSIPLIVGNTVLGVLDLQDDQAGRFAEAERDTFGTLAGLVATAIQNARLFEAQREAEAAIRESQQRLSLLVQQSPLAVIEWNTNFEVVQWNEAAEQIFGYTREEALGHHAAGLIVPEEVRDLVNQVWQDLLTQKGGTRSMNDNFTKDGRVITCEWYNAPLVDVNGNVLGVASLVADITERKQAEQRVRETQQLLQSFLDNFPDLAFAKDTEGRVILGNKALHAFFPTPDGELLGKTVYDLVPAEIADGIWQSEKKLLETGEITEFEEVVPQQGVLHTKLTTKFPLYDTEGNITALGGVSIDITDRKQAETALRTTRASVEQARDAFFWFDADARFTDVSDRTCEILGYTREQLLEMRVFDVDPDFPPAAWPGLKAQIKQTGSVTMESHHRTQDGYVFPVEITVSYLEFGDEEIYFSIARDITERKQAEAEIQKRASELQTVAEVGTAAATILDPDQLLAQVVELTKSNFDLYHAHIYLINETGESLDLAAGAGEAGAQMKAQGWKIAADSATSLVARAFRTREGVIANDVRAAPDFLPNPLLPDTRAELAVPLIVGERTLGVLDVQSDQVDHFTREDVAIQTTLAGQIATALQNAQFVGQVERNLQETELRLNVSQGLAAAQTEDEVLDALIQQMEIYPNTRATIYMAVPEAEEPTITVRRQAQYQCTLPLVPEGMNLPLSQLPMFKDTLEGKPFIASDVLEMETDPATREMIRQMGVRSVISQPLVVGGQFLGVISVSSPEAGYFDEQKLHLYSALAEQGATALQVARLNDATEQERNFSTSVINSLPGIFYVVDAQANLARWNDRYIAMTGYTAEELAVIGALGPIAEEDRAVVAERIQTVFLEGEAEVETHLATKSGERIPYYLTGKRAEIEGKTYVVGMGIDITERARAEAAVRESRRMLEIVMNTLPESIFWKDKDLVYLGCNTNFAQDAGFESPEQVIGKTDHDMPWKDQVALYQADDRHVIETGESKIDYEEPQSTPDGGNIWLRTSKLPLYNEQGEAYAVLGAYADITEEKRAQAALQENEERLGLALEASEAGVWEFLPLAGQAYYDDRWFTMLGYDPHELPQAFTTWRNLLHPDDLATVEPFVNQKVQTGGDFSIEFRMKAKDGDWRWIHAIGKTVATNADGVTTRMLGTHTDVTERVIREAEIQKRASELQTVAEVGTAAATILDPDRLLTQVVELTKTNFGLYHAHIYLMDELGESLVLAAGAGEAGAQMKAQGWKIAADSATSLVARVFRTREGVIANDVRAAPDFLPNPLLPDTRSELAVPLIVGEQVLGVLDVQADQVDRFTREDVSIQTTLAGQIATAIENARLFQESRQVDRLKSEFLANMSHELRTPLNSIIGYIQLLLMDLEGEVPEESYEDMQSIDTNSKHLLNLINDILDLAKIEAGRVELHLEETDVAALLDTVKSNNAGLFIDSPLSFEVSAEEGLPPISVDPVRITQILNNLIANAFKFTETGGITVRAYHEDNDVCIAIQDTGIGIAEKDLEAVFERFRQVDGSFTRRAEGTGLGLSITRLLVEMHKGQLTVRSKLGEGSTFTVHLPAAG